MFTSVGTSFIPFVPLLYWLPHDPMAASSSLTGILWPRSNSQAIPDVFGVVQPATRELIFAYDEMTNPAADDIDLMDYHFGDARRR